VWKLLIPSTCPLIINISLADLTLKISVSGGGGGEEEISARGKPIAESNRVNDIFRKFDSKYGGVKRYYPKVDVAVEVPL
jgi:hypothetical protein